ncbi:MAG TPA: efflux RND transporter permease subunit [Geminicoccus sp.]|jgi:hydrophobe/amphiphile efflux-1 (HAE1) family protein|uniref:efflux RND transporter permease subunit n=1 Tax=Geminicoccus sp. TaxID=2024832 RepID=UPI002E36F904|nr:efflux RND transporter permease subunit [Geminicoccus sp.]HEX2524755.1 efflux RND transporter permease subunit [Geminicoccus sp.]
MTMNVSAWSIRKPMPSIVLFAVLTLLGIYTFQNLSITRFPNIDVPVVSVTITQSGAAPSELESQVTKRVEDAVANLTGVKHVTSTITDGSSVTAIEFRLEVDPDRALNDTKDAVAKIRQDLPRGIDEPITQSIDVAGQAILTYAAVAPAMTLEQLSWYSDDTTRKLLQGLPGVGKVERLGGVDRQFLVSLDPDRLNALGVTPADVNAQLRSTSVDMGGGRAEVAGQEQSIRTLAQARTMQDLAATTIALPGDRFARLDELGTITDSFEEIRSFARLDADVPVVALSVYRSKGASELDVRNTVQKALGELQAQDPRVTYQLIDDAVRYTIGNYESAMSTLIEGAILAVIVVFIFLRDWRATLIAAITLPLSVIPTFFAMELMGFSLNLVSLLAITLVTGILVDDAIVEIENIARHIKMGKSPYRAAMEAADEIGLAVIAITFTIVAVFAPVSFMGGIAGQYFKQFGLTVAVAVLFSLLVARLITPMMAAYFMKSYAHEEPKDGFVMRAYTGLLRATLRHRWLTMLASIGLFALSIWSTGLLPTGFIPDEDAGRTVVSLELPPGATLAQTQRVTDEAVQVTKQIPEVRQVLVIGGSSPTGTLEVRKAAMYVQLTPKSERDRSQKDIELEIARRLSDLPDLRAWYVNERGERQLSISVLSDDPTALREGVGGLEAAMRRIPGFTNVAANAGVERPEIRVVPRLDEAARFGVSTDAIAEAVRVATIGDTEANMAKFDAGDRQVPIRVQLDPATRTDLDLLQVTTVTGTAGVPVPLLAVADVMPGQGPSSIDRYDRERRVVIGADLARGMPLGQATELVENLPYLQQLPKGVRQQATGDAEIMGEVFGGFAAAMGAGLLMMLGVLILLFGSVFHPITILLSLPLSIGGVIFALVVTGNAISMPVVIGILMLMGIVTKNAIMLVDFAVEEQARGTAKHQAIIEAGRKRARPIIMTTIAMVAGMLPSAYGVGDGGEFRAPMAIGVIGGLIVSTLLSLVFVPSFYSVMDTIGTFIGRLIRRAMSLNVPDEPAPKVSHVPAE